MHLSNTVIRKRGASRQLVVILHAWTMCSSDLDDVVSAVEENMADADLLVPNYPSGVLSNADPIQVVEELVDEIQDAADSRRERTRELDTNSSYEKIILIGHSLGALIVRKAFVFAKGQNQDGSRIVKYNPKDWVNSVNRIILMAGTNRGWTLEKKARELSYLHWWLYRIGAFIYRWVRLGRLINSVRSGAPFIVNLRIQWLNLIRQKDNLPTTIQLLGDRDDIVTEEDNVDLQSGARFIYKNVRGTGHANVIKFDEVPDRKKVFLEALLTPTEQLTSDFCPPLETEDTVEMVVFIMHGIRDYGHWTDDLGERIKELGTKKSINVCPLKASYGYFPMIGFLLQPERQDNVRWFTDQYTEAIAKYPNARFCFIGHSNGTYLLASALCRYSAVIFDSVVFAGSVVPRNFPWDKIDDEGRIGRVRNYVASRDWVVAIFPAVFEIFSRNSDLGSGGHNGFLQDSGRKFTIKFVEGGHGAAIVSKNFNAIANFVLGEDVSKEEHDPAVITEKQVGANVLANKFCWLIWIMIFIILGVMCFGSSFAWILYSWHSDKIQFAACIPCWTPAIAGPPIIYYILRFV